MRHEGSVRARLRAARRVHRQRGGARGTGDVVHAVYAGVLLVAFVGVPVVVAAVRALTGPAVLGALTGPGAGGVVATGCGLALAVAAAGGAVRGPALLPPFLTGLLVGSDLPRRAVLARPLGHAAAAVVAVVTAPAVLVGAVLVAAGTATPAACASFALAAAAWGVVAVVVALTGQRLRGHRAGALAVALAAATLFTAVVPGAGVLAPWGWVGLAWPSAGTGSIAGPGWAPVLLVTLAALAAAACTPALLDSLRGPELAEQAQRWQSAADAARTADTASALATYRARPSAGRSWRAVTGSGPVAVARRDLVGALRTPGRCAVGACSLVLGAVVVVLGAGPGGVPAGMGAAVGTGVGYAALGVVSDGFRHAAEAATAPPLYGWSTAGTYARHAVLPTAGALVAAVLGVVGAGVVGAPWGAASVVGLVSVVGPLAVLLVAVRAYDSAKGPLPPVLLTPVPTPAGDVSGLVVLAWQADALLIAATTAAVAVSAPGPTAPVVLAAATVAVVAATQRRLRRL